ncbi:MAG: alpha/beta fold hydrolase [Gemmatimonadota bacterium]
MATDILTRNMVRQAGNGTRPMLFAHGFGCNQDMWRYVAPSFEDDFRTILFDYVGAGGSNLESYSPRRYAALEGYARDILDVCGALELTDVTLVAHSVSCVIGILAALEEPALFSRLVLICPSPRYLNDAPDYVGGFEPVDVDGLLDMMDKNYIGWATFLAPVVMGPQPSSVPAEELEASFCSTDPTIARQFAEVTFRSDNRDDLAGVTVPTLILQCADDAIAPASVGQFVHGEIRGSVLHEMTATGHCPHMSHPGETIEAIRSFLRSTDGSSPSNAS